MMQWCAHGDEHMHDPKAHVGASQCSWLSQERFVLP